MLPATEADCQVRHHPAAPNPVAVRVPVLAVLAVLAIVPVPVLLLPRTLVGVILGAAAAQEAQTIAGIPREVPPVLAEGWGQQTLAQQKSAVLGGTTATVGSDDVCHGTAVLVEPSGVAPVPPPPNLQPVSLALALALAATVADCGVHHHHHQHPQQPGLAKVVLGVVPVLWALVSGNG